MALFYFVLLLLAVVSFGLAAVDVAVRRVNLVALGLLCVTLIAFLKALASL